MKFDYQKMRELREAADMSQEELATKIGISRLGIIKLEKGRSEPRIDIINKLGAALGVPGKYFII